MLRGRDPSAVAVLLEDSAAVTGILMAGTALWLSHITGNSIYDACGSIAIGGKCCITVLITNVICIFIKLYSVNYSDVQYGLRNLFKLH